MKRLLVALALTSIPAFSQARDDDPLADQDTQGPMTLQERYAYQTEKFNQIMAELQTNEVFAGRLSEVSFRNQTYVIDRTLEAVAKKTPGTPPRAAALGSLLNDLGVKAEGKIRIKVTSEVFGKDGKLESRDVWEIDVGGMWQAETGMDDANDKSHK